MTLAVELWQKLEAGGLRFVKAIDVEPNEFIKDPLLVTEDISDLTNIYYTLAHTERRKAFVKCKYFMFDVDDLDFNQPVEDTARVVVGALGLNWDETMVVITGNGLQVVIELDKWVEDKAWFKERKKAYKKLCDKVNRALLEQGLQGQCDTTVFEPMRLARVPGTINEKTKNQRKIIKNATTLQGESKPVDFDFGAIEPTVEEEHEYNWDREVDVEGITSENGCLVLQWAGKNQTLVKEPLWHALLGLIAAMPKGVWREYLRKYFGNHPGYNEEECIERLERWRTLSGPVTCGNINLHSELCLKCPHFQKVRRPSDIESEGFIKTKNTGFRFMRQDGSPGRVDFEGLCKYYKKTFGLLNTDVRQFTYKWADTHWVKMEDPYLLQFCREKVRPLASSAQREEFKKTLKTYNIKPESFLTQEKQGRINFANGVLDTKTKEILPHAKKYGFGYVIPIKLEPRATSPKFREYLLNLMCGDEDLTTLIMEYIGYIISGDRPWANRAMMFEGTGANGKSALIELIRKAVGKENTSYISLRKFNDEQSLANLEGRLFNVSTENDASSFRRGTEVFKSLVAGEPIEVKEVYAKKVFIEPIAKHIFACNEIPYNYDNSYGFNRRLFLIPFKQEFRKNANINIVQEMTKEIPGMIMDCLDLYLKAKERKNFTVAKASIEMAKQYETENSPVKRFIEDEVVEASEMHVTRTQLYARFSVMCEYENIKPMSKTLFLKQFRMQYPRPLEEKKFGLDGNRVRGFQGITLIPEAERDI